MENEQLWTWLESLIWCPSQIYYFFTDQKTGKNYCIYLRWRHRDPWTAELIPCDDKLEFDNYSTWETIETPKIYTEDEYKELESDVLEIIKARFPETNFPENG